MELREVVRKAWISTVVIPVYTGIQESEGAVLFWLLDPGVRREVMQARRVAKTMTCQR